MKAGLIPEIRSPGKTRLICKLSLERMLGMKVDCGEEQERKICIYSRVSSKSQKVAGNLDRQIERMIEWAFETFGVESGKLLLVSDIASAFGSRRGLENVVDLMMEGKLSHLCVEFSDRLSRTSSEKRLLEFLAKKHNVEILAARQTMPEDEKTFFVKELVDFIQVVANKSAAMKAADLTRIEITPEAESRIMQLYSEGHTLTKIAAILKDENITCPKTGKFISYDVLRNNFNKNEMMARFLDEASGGKEIDWVGRFLKERCVTGPNLKILSRELYPEFLLFAQKNKIKHPPTQHDLGRNLTRRGFRNFRASNARMCWEGITLARSKK